MRLCSERTLKGLTLLFLTLLILFTFLEQNQASNLHLEGSLDRVLSYFSTVPVDADSETSLRRQAKRKVFLPPAYYQRDRGGAIDVFEKNGASMCRIYRVCRMKNGQVYYPRWMKKHHSVLEEKCGLTDLNFAPVKSLKNEFGTPMYYDWLGPNLRTPALLKFSKNPTSHFFAHKNATKSLLETNQNVSSVHRTCIPAPRRTRKSDKSAVCDSQPEGHIAHPAILVNTIQGQPKAESDFYSLYRRTYMEKHGESVTILDPTSRLLRRPIVCFRSVIASASADHDAGFTAESSAAISNNASQWAAKRETNTTTDPENAPREESVSNQSIEAQSTRVLNTSTYGMLNTFDEYEDTQLNSEQGQKHLVHKMELEGGVELFTHRAVDGQRWNNSKQEELSKQVYGICRVYRACRGADQSIVLPNWMKNNSVQLKEHCGIDSVTFLQDDEFDLMYEKVRVSSRNRRFLNPRASQPDMEVFFDLIGMREYRAQKHHFVTDFLHDGIHSLDALFNRDETGMTSFKRQCIYRPDSGVRKTALRDWVCAHAPVKIDELRPVLIVNDRIKSSGSHGKYIRQLAAMMPPKKGKGPGMLLNSELSRSGYNQSTCFRSIVFTRNSYPPSSVLDAAERNIFFAQNNISREPAKGSGEGECEVHVTMLRPQKQKGNRWFKNQGELTNEEDIVAAIETLGKAILDDSRSKEQTANIIVRRMKHSGLDIEEDKKLIQQSHIIISTNNPSLTGIVFAKPGTVVVEVQPFSYSAGPYRSFAGTLHLDYQSVMANADYQAFESCVKDSYKKDWGESVSASEMEAKKEGLLKLFRDARDNFNGASSALHLEKRVLDNGGLREFHIPQERICARAQRLTVDANLIAIIVGKKAAALCQKHAEHRLRSDAVL